MMPDDEMIECSELEMAKMIRDEFEQRIAELREEIQNGDIMVLEPLMKDIAKLKESLKRNIHIVLGDTSLKYTQLKEVLREFLIHYKNHYEYLDENKCDELLQMLSGEKSEDDLTPGTARASSTDSKPEEPSDDNKQRLVHITTCPKCGVRVEVICRFYKNNPIEVEKEEIKKMILEIRNNIYGFETEEWFTPIEQQIGYDYREDLERILEERKELRKKHLEEQTK